MEWNELMSHVDHTLLKPECTWPQIRTLCDEALEFGCASVCIPPVYVRRANAYVGTRLKICTVIGFPNGNTTTAVKVFETEDAVRNGADEIDMVIHIGMVKQHDYAAVKDEIAAVKTACAGRILKVIIETCLLTDEEKTELCRVVADAGADYIKTSTGFNAGGATREDVALLRRASPAALKVKAAGGIATLQDAQDFLALGADRLGTSRLVGLVRAEQKKA